MDRYEEMRTFASVAEHGVNGTGRRMRLVPSAVSRRVKDLEARLGTTLLTRSGRRLVLTDAGREYLEGVRRVLGEIDEVEARVTDANAALSGQIRLAVPLSFGLAWVVPAIIEFQRRYPGVVVDLDLNDRRVDVAREGFDLALRIGSLADSALVAKKVSSCPMIVAASTAFVTEHGPIERPDDLADLPALTYSPSPRPDRWTWSEDGEDSEVRVRSVLTANNGDALRDAAKAGLGLVCLPSFIVQASIGEGDLVRLLPTYDFGTLDAYALWPQRDYQARRVRVLIDHLADGLRED